MSLFHQPDKKSCLSFVLFFDLLEINYDKNRPAGIRPRTRNDNKLKRKIFSLFEKAYHEAVYRPEADSLAKTITNYYLHRLLSLFYYILSSFVSAKKKKKKVRK